MYLSELFISNFRAFGSADSDGEDQPLTISLAPGFNVLVGENDSGKSAVIDAIRYCLWTTSLDYHRLTIDDFYCDATRRAEELLIRCRFDDLSKSERAAFLEHLTPEESGHAVLFVTLRGRRQVVGGTERVSAYTHSGPAGEGPMIEGPARELLRTTYLRPLRNAERELQGGRNSRLSQILASYPRIAAEAEDDFDVEVDAAETLVGIMRRAEYHIRSNESISRAQTSIDEKYLSRLSLGADEAKSEIGIGETSLKGILEKLELRLEPATAGMPWTPRGLGYNNALFMAAELLLLRSVNASSTLLIEEPEAHLHPQLQHRVIELLGSPTEEDEPGTVQVVMTTHSPYLAASVPVGCMTVLSDRMAYRLAPAETQLSDDDYQFLERFLDVTKANLFFARGVLIVEGDAENILLPALADAVGYSLSRAGVSIVNVGHTGLFRYSRIFQRSDGTSMPVRVACIRDRDIVPDGVPDDWKPRLPRESAIEEATKERWVADLRRHDGGAVRTFTSDTWTFEHDLAAASWLMAKVVHAATQSALQARTEWPDADDRAAIRNRAFEEVERWREQDQQDLASIAVDVFEPLRRGNVSKAIAAQFAALIIQEIKVGEDDLPEYLIEAFRYVVGADG